MGVGSEDHASATGKLLPDVLMDDSLVGRHIDATILLGGGKAEHVVVLIDSATYRAKGVVAVGHRIRDWELLQSARTGCLDDTDICDVVRCHGIETDAHLLALGAVHIVCAEDSVGDCVFTCLVRRRHAGRIGDDGLPVQEINAVRGQFYHNDLV